MNFTIDGSSIVYGGGFVLLLIFLAFAISAVRFNGIRRPARERAAAGAREAKAPEERMIHENDVPTDWNEA